MRISLIDLVELELYLSELLDIKVDLAIKRRGPHLVRPQPVQQVVLAIQHAKMRPPELVLRVTIHTVRLP